MLAGHRLAGSGVSPRRRARGLAIATPIRTIAIPRNCTASRCSSRKAMPHTVARTGCRSSRIETATALNQRSVRATSSQPHAWTPMPSRASQACWPAVSENDSPSTTAQRRTPARPPAVDHDGRDPVLRPGDRGVEDEDVGAVERGRDHAEHDADHVQPVRADAPQQDEPHQDDDRAADGPQRRAPAEEQRGEGHQPQRRGVDDHRRRPGADAQGRLVPDDHLEPDDDAGRRPRA